MVRNRLRMFDGAGYFEVVLMILMLYSGVVHDVEEQIVFHPMIFMVDSEDMSGFAGQVVMRLVPFMFDSVIWCRPDRDDADCVYLMSIIPMCGADDTNEAGILRTCGRDYKNCVTDHADHTNMWCR